MESSHVLFVIVPVYNAEEYIAQTLDSVLAQPYEKIRIVCVDDGSSDNSIGILREYESRCPNVCVLQQDNAGVSAARNTGIEYVLDHCGEQDYLSFLDADDLWANDSVTEQNVAIFDGMDCVGFSSVRTMHNLSRVASAPHISADVLPGGQSSIWCHSGHPMGAVFYSCELVRRYHIRFIYGLKYAEDGLFKFVCLFLAEKIRLVDQVLYLYRINAGSAMHSRKFGTDYMPDIIRGYMQTGLFLSQYENADRGNANFCHVLAGVYTIEMIAEHYQHFRSTAALDQFLTDNPDIAIMIGMLDPGDLSDNHRQLYDMYISNPKKFRWNNYLAGARLWGRKLIAKNRFWVQIGEKRRFPQKNIYL